MGGEEGSHPCSSVAVGATWSCHARASLFPVQKAQEDSSPCFHWSKLFFLFPGVTPKITQLELALLCSSRLARRCHGRLSSASCYQHPLPHLAADGLWCKKLCKLRALRQALLVIFFPEVSPARAY